MKVKFTNNVKNRRNIRKQQIGSLVTSALRYQNEVSLENLAGQVSRRLNRTIAQIYPAVNRTLNCGVRDGFIAKHGNKYSLSSRRNCETDGRRRKKNPLEKCLSATTNCHANSRQTKCLGLDLIIFERCSYKKSGASNYCRFHNKVQLIFRYMIFFVKNIVRVIEFYDRGDIDESNVGQIVAILKMYPIITKDAAEIYVEFLENYFKFTQKFDSKFESILLGKQKGNPLRIHEHSNECCGTDLQNGQFCGSIRDFGNHCARHVRVRNLQKLFMHGKLKGDGLHADTVRHVLNNIHNVTNEFTDEERKTLIELPDCLRLYMSLVVRLADCAISQFQCTDEKSNKTINIQIKETNKATTGDCMCQCVGLDVGNNATRRINEIEKNVNESRKSAYDTGHHRYDPIWSNYEHDDTIRTRYGENAPNNYTYNELMNLINQ